MNFIELNLNFIELNLNFIELKLNFIELKLNFIELKLNFIELKLNFIELKLNYGIEYCYNRLAIIAKVKTLNSNSLSAKGISIINNSKAIIGIRQLRICICENAVLNSQFPL